MNSPLASGAASGRAPRLHVNAGAAFLAMAAQTILALATYGYLVRMVGAAEVGIWVSLMAAGMLACLADLGLNFALIRQLSVAMNGQTTSPNAQALATMETIVTTVALAAGASLLLAWWSYPWWIASIGTPAMAMGSDTLLAPLLVGLWLNRMAETLAGALDGQQRFVERSLATAAALLLGLALTVSLVPRWGMQGFALAFVVQNALLVTFFGARLHRLCPGLRWLRPRLEPSILRDALRYGLSVQFMVMCYLVIESTVKLSLARGGNLAEVAYFDLAFRIGRGVRGLLASALRVLVPLMAPRAATDVAAEARHQAYAKSFSALQLFALPAFAAVMAFGAEVSAMLVGHSEPAFIWALVASLGAWLAYSLTDPAMNLALASGRMRWPVLGHALALVLVLIQVALTAHGHLLSGGGFTLGLYVQVAMSILAGCIASLIGVHVGESAGTQLLRPLPTFLALVGTALVAGFGLSAAHWFPHLPAAARWAATAAAWALFTALLWRLNPVGQQLRVKLAARLPKSTSA